MKDPDRKEDARQRAEEYAPRPRDSRALYGVVAASVALVAAIAVGRFYAIDLGGQLLSLTVITVLAFGAGLVVRRVRMHRHRKAHRAEYDDALPAARIGAEDNKQVAAARSA